MAKPTDWIGPFIEDELAAVIDWLQNIAVANRIAYDPEARFEDDGSNFRSIVGQSALPAAPLVQVVEVISGKDPVTFLITDGFTDVMAKLSENAVHTLEQETEGAIHDGIKGEVFSIKEAIVASTSYGRPDEHIQLEIQELEYMYYLRKSFGQAHPILDRPKAKRLFENIADIRQLQYEESYVHAQATRSDSGKGSRDVDSNTFARTSRNGDQDAEYGSQRPRSQDSMSLIRDTLPSDTPRSRSSWADVATQLPVSRKRKAPSLADDGIEILQGNNLARPHGLGFTAPTSRPLSSKRPHLDSRDTAKLLDLLSKKPGNVSSRPNPALSIEKSPMHSTPAPAPTSIVPDITGEVEQMSIVGPSQDSILGIQQAAIELDTPTHLRPRGYARQRVPIDQRILLDRQESWFRSLPGKRFPHPNIPIQLLKTWHDSASLEMQEVVVVDPEPEGNTEPGNMDVDSSDRTSESSAEEFTVSQWPPTPTQQRPQRPPDSSLPHNSPIETHPQLQKQQHDPEQPIELSSDNDSNSSAINTPRVEQSLLPCSSALNTPLKKKQTPQQSPLERNGCTALSGHGLSRFSKLSRLPPSANESILCSEQPKRWTPGISDTPNSHSRPTTTDGIVKATQLPQDDDVDMDMEMSVPRSLQPVLPAVAHREKRSRHFRRIQREQWLRDTYDHDPCAKSISLGTILTVYKSTHGHDREVRLPEFAEALQAAFPQLYPTGSDTAVGGLKSKSAKAPKVRSVEPAKDVVMIDTDSEAGEGETSLRRVPVEGSRRDQIVDLTREKNDYGSASSKYSSPLRPRPRAHGRHASTENTGSGAEILQPPAHTLDHRGNHKISRRGDVVAEGKERVMNRKMPWLDEKETGDNEARLATQQGGQRAFEEFADAMKNVRPNGAFVDDEHESYGRGEAESRWSGIRGQRLNVMDWEI